MTLPARADVVIIGGGIIGCSIAYHLTKIGVRDVLLLERRQLCCGTTWHSVGSVAEFRGSSFISELASYSARLYQDLEAETGQSTGYRKTGSIMLALNRERVMEMERSAALARAIGHEAEMISIDDVRERCSQVFVDDALAGFYLPSDGRTNPIDTTQALAKGARMGGARIVENVAVTGLDRAGDAVNGVVTEQGAVKADAVVLAVGMWAREFAAPYGVCLPLQAAEHFYAVTESIDGLQRSMPFIRVPDESTYYKEDAGKLLFGCLEKQAKPWALDGIPKDFCFDSLPEDIEHFEPILTPAIRRFPLLEKAGIQLFFNGPESFTPDGNALMGETPELRNLFVACGMNTVGVMLGGGIGRMMASWIHDRRRPEGFGDFDVARVSGFEAGRTYLRDRTVEALGMLYNLAWPNREYASCRGGRRSALHERHVAANCVFGNRAGWEVPLAYAPDGVSAALAPSYTRQNWVPWAAEDVRAAEESTAFFDLSANAKLRVRGREAVRALAALSAEPEIEEGLSSALWLTEAGRIRCQVSVVKLSDSEAIVLSLPGTERLHAQWMTSHGVARASLQEATSAYALALLLGPRAETLLEACGAQGLHEPLQQTAIGFAPTILASTSVGKASGWLLLVPTEFAAHAFEAIDATDETRLGGHYALEMLRISAGQAAWPQELNDTVSPVEAGFSLSLRGTTKASVVPTKLKGTGNARSTALVHIRLCDDRGALYGAEGILRNGKTVGLTTSGSWCRHAKTPVALGYVSEAAGIDHEWLGDATFAIDMPGGPALATVNLVAADGQLWRRAADPGSQIRS